MSVGAIQLAVEMLTTLRMHPHIDIVNISTAVNSYTAGTLSIPTSPGATNYSRSVNLGYKPSRVIAYYVGAGRGSGWIDSVIGYRHTSTIGNSYGITGVYSDAPISISLTSTGFTISFVVADCCGTWYYIALK